LLLDGNPAITNLRFQVLMSILWSEDRFDEDQFDRLAEYLASGRFDRRYSAPHELIGIGRSKLRGAVIRRQSPAKAVIWWRPRRPATRPQSAPSSASMPDWRSEEAIIRRAFSACAPSVG